MTRLPSLIAVLAAAALAGACGNAAPTAVPGSQDRYVYLSVEDCTRGGKLDAEKCENAISRAITFHDRNGPKHKKLKECEDAEGSERCERIGNDFRPRPAAYLFTLGPQPFAAPLYASKGATTFKSADATVYDPDKTAGVVFSSAAVSRSESFVPKKK